MGRPASVTPAQAHTEPEDSGGGAPPLGASIDITATLRTWLSDGKGGKVNKSVRGRQNKSSIAKFGMVRIRVVSGPGGESRLATAALS